MWNETRPDRFHREMGSLLVVLTFSRVSTNKESKITKLSKTQIHKNHHLLTPIDRISILLPERQQPTWPLSRSHRLRRRMLWRRAIQLRKRHRPRRHRIRSLPSPRRRGSFRQIEENLTVHVTLLIARHGLWSILGEFGHFDGVGAGGAFALRGDDGEG